MNRRYVDECRGFLDEYFYISNSPKNWPKSKRDKFNLFYGYADKLAVMCSELLELNIKLDDGG